LERPPAAQLFVPLRKVPKAEQAQVVALNLTTLRARMLGKEKRLKEIHLSKRDLIVAVILAVVIALGILAIQALQLYKGSQPSASNQEDTLASKAAASALKAFFHVDSQEGKGTWLNRFCALSTPTGCQFVTTGADLLWNKFHEAKANVTATVTPDAKVAETATEQVWKMAIDLSAPLPGSNKTQDSAYVAVIKTENGWKFDRFLLDPEIKAILARQALTVTPGTGGK